MYRISFLNQKIYTRPARPGGGTKGLVLAALLILWPIPCCAQGGVSAPLPLGSSPRDRAIAEGLMNHYVVNTMDGRFEAHGDAMLRRLKAERRAIGSVRQISRGEAFGGSLKDAVTGPFRGANGFITRPAGALRAVSRGLAALPGRARETLTNTRSIYEDNLVEALLSVSKSKREFASAAGVDVYSRNPVLQRELDSVARAEAAGGFGASTAVAVATFAGSLATSNLQRADELNDILRTRSAAELRSASRKALKQSGLPDPLTERFLDHYWYSPRHETVIAASLLAIEGAAGREDFIERALAANSEETALFFQQMAEMMRGFHTTVAPIEQIEIFFGIPLIHGRDGSVAALLPFDRVHWTARTAEVAAYVAHAHPKIVGAGKLVLWTPGTLTDRARQGFAALGIGVRERTDAILPLLD